MTDTTSGDGKSENEKIVDELTSDFEKINPEKILNESDNDSEPESKPDQKIQNPFDDEINEDQLKQIEETLTEEEKLKRKDESSELKKQGNDQFKNGSFIESVNTYTCALRLCPLSYGNERAIFYANRAASKIQLGYKESALEDCTKALELNPNYVRALYRRAKLYENMEKLDESLEDYKKLQVLDESNAEVRNAVLMLSQRIETRNQEMKDEMLGKLKDLGNMLLKPFGLSTENFQLNKDDKSGGYSVNFQQKK